jgi:hypothetical protein
MAQKIESPKQPAIVPRVPPYTAIDQNSPHQPAVVADRAPGSPVYTPLYHMVFTSNDGTNSILYATSPDGFTNWTLGPAPGQTSDAAPALAQYFVSTLAVPGGQWTITTNLLVLVFVATNSLIQYAILDLTENPNYRAWRFGGSLWRNFGQAVSVCPQLDESFVESQSGRIVTQSTPLIAYYNDSSNRLLETSFDPQ